MCLCKRDRSRTQFVIHLYDFGLSEMDDRINSTRRSATENRCHKGFRCKNTFPSNMFLLIWRDACRCAESLSISIDKIPSKYSEKMCGDGGCASVWWNVMHRTGNIPQGVLRLNKFRPDQRQTIHSIAIWRNTSIDTPLVVRAFKTWSNWNETDLEIRDENQCNYQLLTSFRPSAMRSNFSRSLFFLSNAQLVRKWIFGSVVQPSSRLQCLACLVKRAEHTQEIYWPNPYFADWISLKI